MAKGKRQIVAHRRRRQLKTNYSTRLTILKSGKPRLVVRKSVKNIVCQIIDYKTEGDVCIVTADSKELKKFGWKGNTGNIPASYLTGILCGMKAKKAKVSEAILDIGLNRSTKGNRIYAALKGAVDSGLNVPHSEKVLPSDERIMGTHISTYAERVKKEGSGSAKEMFSLYEKSKLSPQSIDKHVEEIKNKILKS